MQHSKLINSQGSEGAMAIPWATLPCGTLASLAGLWLLCREASRTPGQAAFKQQIPQHVTCVTCGEIQTVFSAAPTSTDCSLCSHVTCTQPVHHAENDSGKRGAKLQPPPGSHTARESTLYEHATTCSVRGQLEIERGGYAQNLHSHVHYIQL